jgi:hypothetical protein
MIDKEVPPNLKRGEAIKYMKKSKDYGNDIKKHPVKTDKSDSDTLPILK